MGGWVKKSLKQIVFEPSQLETKHLVLSPKIENPFHLHKLLKLCLVPQTLNPQDMPITAKNL
jgi:hypothetical protein